MGEQLGFFRHGPAEAMHDRGAILSPGGVYRYRLWRIWDDDLAPCAFVMLNPSTADAEVDDPTIRRCVGFAKSWGSGGIVVVNLFAYRATDPDALAEVEPHELVGRDADEHMRKVFSVTDVVVCAWGATLNLWGERWRTLQRDRARAVLSLIPEGVEVCCLGTTKGGHPRHPLYLAKNTPRVPFEVPRG